MMRFLENLPNSLAAIVSVMSSGAAAAGSVILGNSLLILQAVSLVVGGVIVPIGLLWCKLRRDWREEREIRERHLRAVRLAEIQESEIAARISRMRDSGDGTKSDRGS